MRFIAPLLICASFAVTAARADDAPLTVGQCFAAYNGLIALDHYEDANGKPKQYKLGGLRGTIGLNIGALRHVAEAVEKARLDLIAEIGGGAQAATFNAKEMARLNTEYRKMLDAPCDVRPGRLKMSDLRIGDGPDENAIPPGALSDLSPILDQ